MPERGGPSMPEAPGRGHGGTDFVGRANNYARVSALLTPGKIGGNRACLGRPGPAWDDGKSEETDL
jgi:hypothetical protein